MYRLLLAIAGIFFSVLTSAGTGEDVYQLNGVWSFKTDPYCKGESEKWYAEESSAGWDALPVPGNWELKNEYVNYIGKGWYKRTFSTPEITGEKKAFIRFEAVNIHYTVWVNGTNLGTIKGGYFPHKFDVTSLLKKDGKNVVAVCVDNNLRTGAYWNWGGIRRPVSLVVTNKENIERVRIQAEPDLKSGKATIEIQPYFSTQLSEAFSVLYEVEKDGKTIAKKTVRDAASSVSLSLSKKQVKLWHFDRPELYKLHVSLMKGKECVHRITERFGIRKISWDDTNFYLNGESVRLLGLNWVADDRFTGNTLPADVYKAHIDDMRRMGAVMARLSHVPLPKDVLDYLDEVGMLVIDEIPIWGDNTPFAFPHNEIAFSWLKQMVENHCNHPCIVGWSVGNEIGNQVRNPQVTPYVKSAIEYVKSMDQTRPALDVSFSAHYNKVNDPSQYSDIYAYNCYSRGAYGKNSKMIVANYGKKPLFVTEFGCQLISENLQSDFKKETDALNDMRGIDFLFGASLWTYNDYRSTHRSPSPTWDNPVSENRAWGVVDAYGRHKQAYWSARKEYAPLKSWKVTKEAEGKYSVVLTPREKLDLPAYVLDGYKLALKTYSKAGEVLDSTEISLARIKPGDPALKKVLAINEKSAAYNKVALVNPNGIELMDTVWYNSCPDKPVIKEYRTAYNALRIYLQPTWGATAYWVECEDLEKGKVLVSDTVAYPTQIDISRLEHQKKYKVTLFAGNNKGKSVSEAITIVGNGDGVLPPEVKKIQGIPALNSIAIGYSCNMAEYLFEVEYAESADMKVGSKRILTTAKGACFIPELGKGKKYYVRIRSYYQYQQISEWSPVYAVVL